MKQTFRHLLGAAVFGVAAISAASVPTAMAQELTVGRQTEPASLDPHFSRTGPNQMTATHIFDTLVDFDANIQASPGLAESWKQLDATTWEFKLRQGVKFHDGSDFDAQDVLASITRVPWVPNSPASFAANVKNIAETVMVDPFTLQFKLKKADPNFPGAIGLVYIVADQAVEAATDDFNSGKAAIGTGPYKFVEWKRAEKLVLKRNDGYWGNKPKFEDVTFRFISNDAARVAALLSGAVDVIDVVPPSDIPKLSESKDVTLWNTPSSRLIYLHVDSSRDQTPFAMDADGKPLAKNPLKDARVRLAISKLINRDGIVDRVLSGAGVPAGQMVPPGMFGYDPDLKPAAYDPAGAKALLADAGYPKGFNLTIHGPNNRYVNDGEVLQTIGQLLARGGINVKVETMPSNVYFKRATKREFSLFLVGFGSVTGESSRGLNFVMHSYAKEKGFGSNNRGRYSNPAFDTALEDALSEPDLAAREAKLRKAARIGFDDVGIIPLHWQVATWASRAGVTVEPRQDERTLAMGMK